MTSMLCYGNSDLDKIHRSRNFGVDIILQFYVLVRCDLHLKLEGVTTEKSNRTALRGRGTYCVPN